MKSRLMGTPLFLLELFRCATNETSRWDIVITPPHALPRFVATTKTQCYVRQERFVAEEEFSQ